MKAAVSASDQENLSKQDPSDGAWMAAQMPQCPVSLFFIIYTLSLIPNHIARKALLQMSGYLNSFFNISLKLTDQRFIIDAVFIKLLYRFIN
jgi:hypothetical protein